MEDNRNKSTILEVLEWFSENWFEACIAIFMIISVTKCALEG